MIEAHSQGAVHQSAATGYLPSQAAKLNLQTATSTPASRIASDASWLNAGPSTANRAVLQRARVTKTPEHGPGINPKNLLVQAAVLLSSLPAAQALCWCKTYLAKVYSHDGHSYSKQVPLDIGCNDLDLKTECERGEWEINDFLSSVMRTADTNYFTPLQFANQLTTKPPTEKQDELLSLAHERNVLANAVEERARPDCASGLHTTTPLALKPDLLQNPDNRDILIEWPILASEAPWDLASMQGEGFCYSDSLLAQIQDAKADNTINSNLTVTGFTPANPSDSHILTPYTKRIMDRLIEKNVSSTLQNLIWDRIGTEPPDIRVPSADFHGMVKTLVPATSDQSKNVATVLTALTTLLAFTVGQA